MTARHRVSKQLLRHGRVYPQRVDVDGRAPHAGSRSQQFDELASELAFADAIAAVDGLTARKSALAERLSRLASDEQWWPTVARLRCFRGIDTLTALALHLELAGDWQRFKRAPALGSWLGLTPSLSAVRRVGTQRVDHQDRLHARAPVVGRIGLALQPSAADRRDPAQPPTRPARPRPADLKPRPTAPAPRPHADARPRQAAQHHRRRSRSRAGLLPLGGRDRRLTSVDNAFPVGGPGRRATRAAGTRDRSMSSTPTRGATLVPRQRTPAAKAMPWGPNPRIIRLATPTTSPASRPTDQTPAQAAPRPRPPTAT